MPLRGEVPLLSLAPVPLTVGSSGLVGAAEILETASGRSMLTAASSFASAGLSAVESVKVTVL